MKKKVFAFLLSIVLLILGPVNALLVISAQALSAPVITVEEKSNDGSTIVAAINIESGSFSALNLKFQMLGLECISIQHGEALESAENDSDNQTTVTDSTNINTTADGKSNISFACTPEYEVQGELYIITFKVISLKDYNFNIECLKCYQYSENKYKKVVPSITSNVSYDKTTFDKTSLLKYSVNNGEITITGCATDIFHKFEMPNEINGYPVRYIGEKAFYNCKYLTEIIIPDNVTLIGEQAFYGCTGLTSATISNSVTVIGDSAFYGCENLKEISIPDGVDYIGSCAFSYCNSLEKIFIPENVIQIGYDAFYKTAYYNDSNNWDAGVLYIGKCLIKLRGYKTSYNIKDGTILLADQAFANTNICGISIPDSMKYIGESCFLNCNNLEYLCSQKDYIFDDKEPTEPSTEPSTDPTTTTRPAKEPSTDPTTTRPTTKPTIKSSTEAVTTMFYTASEESNNESKMSVIPSNVMLINKYAFKNCDSLKSIFISEGVEIIQEGAFLDCNKLEKIIVDSDNKAYSNDDTGCLFDKEMQVLIQYPIGSKRTEYDIPETTVNISSKAFSGCKTLEKISIPTEMNVIGDSAFAGCNALKELNFDAREVYYSSIYSNSPFYNLPSLEIVNIGEKVQNLPDGFVYGCTGIKSISIPDSVTYIGEYAFAGCSNLTEIRIPEKVTFIGEKAFNGCNSITRLKYEAISGSYGGTGSSSPFYNLSSLESIEIGENVTSLPNSFIYGCQKINYINIPNSVETINDYAFCNCTNLFYAIIGEGVTKVGKYSFNGTALKHVFYRGDETKKEAMSINSDRCLTEATWHNSVSTETELFSDITTVPATCVDSGYTKYTCAICSGQFNGKTTPVNPSAHHYVDGVCVYCSFKQPFDITINSFNSVKIDNAGDIVRFRFVPEKSSTYYFYSDSKSDTYGYIYNGSFNTLATNDDGGNGSNFCVSYSMTAGTVYYLGARLYSSSATGDFSVSITEDYNASMAHDFEQTVMQASCISDGRIKKLCKNCGYITDEKTEESFGHSFADGVCTICDCPEGLEVTKNNADELVIRDYTGSASNLVIPSSICGFSVVSIGDNAFSDCDSLTSITIPDGVMSIGNDAFYNCSSLTSITIPDGVTSIGNEAFYNCSSLTSIVIPDSVTSIGNHAFSDCSSLISITIPNSVISICYRAFSGCENLANIAVDENNQVYDSRNNCNAIIEKSTNTLISGCKNSVIPNSVTSIDNYAFSGCDSLTSIVIPDSVTSIGNYAFSGCDSLTSITIPDSVMSIGDYAFYSCDSLTSITIPDSVTSIGDSVFSWCESITSITIPDSVNSIGDYAFYYCTGLTSIAIPYNVKKIGKNAFANCSMLKSVDFLNELEETNLSFLSVQSTDNGSRTSGDLNDDARVNSADVLLLLRYCVGLSELSSEQLINADVNSNSVVDSEDAYWIMNYSVGLLSSFEEVMNYESQNPVFSINCIEETDSKVVVAVNLESGSFNFATLRMNLLTQNLSCTKIERADNWKDFCEDHENDEGPPIIALNKDNGMSSICSLSDYDIYGSILLYTFSKSFSTTISYMLEDYIQLYVTDVEADVKQQEDNNDLMIESGAFRSCVSLTNFSFPYRVISVGDYAFSDCGSLTSIVIPASVTSIGHDTFYGCSSLTSITIPDSVTSIGEDAFGDYFNGYRSVFYSGTQEKWEAVEKNSSGLDSKGTYIHFSVSADEAASHLKYEVTQEPTCYESGERTVTCDCGYSYTETLSSLEHQGEYVRTVAPTCTSSGYKVYHCSRCDNDYNAEYTNSLGHDGTKVRTVEPTCTSKGYTVYHCNRCDEDYNDDYIDELGHNFENDVCTRCGNIIDVLALGEYKTVTLQNSEIAYFKFIPETDGTYYFYSDSSYDTFGYVYDSNFNGLSSDDDGGNGNNFCVSYSMTAGTIYYLGANYYSLSETRCFSVCVTDNFDYATAHDFERKETHVSCLLDGKVEKICKNCGYTANSEILEKSYGHIFSDGICTICGCPEGLEITINEDEELIINDYIGSATNLVIPSSICGYPVVSIGDYAFWRCDSLKSITIPDSVISIGDSVFSGCENLANIVVDENNQVYDSRNNCNAIIEKSTNTLISGCKNSVIPDSVTSIGEDAFSSCERLTSIIIPDSVTSIGYRAFYNCSSLTSIVILNSVTSIGNYAFSDCDGLISITIPDSVTSIGDSVFSGCESLTSIIIPDSVTSIGDHAFYNCSSLTSITIPDSVTSIGYRAFSRCDSLASISVDENNQVYDSRNNCNAIIEKSTNTLISGCKNSVIPDSVTSIGESAFCYCESLTNITIPDSVTSIGDYAFSDCDSLISIIIPNSVTSIGYSAFEYCDKLTSITIPDSVTSIDNYVFYDCNSLTSITIPNSVTSIGNYAFSNCDSLISITIPDSVTSIGDGAFSSCDSLTSIVIPDSVTSISYDVFESCNSLKTVFYSGTKEDWSKIERNSSELEQDSIFIHYGVSMEDVPEHLHMVVIREPNCCDNGRQNITCDCGYSYSVTIHALGHQKGEFVRTVAPTCTNNGYSVYRCLRCGKEYESDNVYYLNHEKGEWIKTVGPTCTDEGYSVYRCNRCKKLYNTNYVRRLRHQAEFINTVDPTCTDRGYTTYYCKRCNEEYNDDYVDSLGHDIENGICLRCDYVIPEIELGDIKTLSLKPSESAYFKFTPKESGTFYFYSYGNNRTYGYVFDNEMNEICSDDASGYYLNFKISFDFVAGNTYYLAVKGFLSYVNHDIVLSLSDSFKGFTTVPRTKTVIDDNNKIIYGIDAGTKNYDIGHYIANYDYYNEFSNKNNNDMIGTGTILSLLDKETEDIVDSYTFIIFGDVNGDGWYDGQDAVTVSMIANGMLTREQVGEAVWMAADCNHDGKIDQADVDLLNQAGLLLSSVDQTKSTEELLETSSEYNEYLNLIDQSVGVKSDEPEQESPETQKPSLLEFLLTTIWNYIKLILSLFK